MEGNRFLNPGFEGAFKTATIWSYPENKFIEYTIAGGWWPAHCGVPYTPEECLAPWQCEEDDIEGEGCNPEGLLMRRPEYKPIATIPGPHSGNNAQQWFCMFSTCFAGVYQTVITQPGEVCTVGAWVREWYNYDDDPESDIEKTDDMVGSFWQVRVDVTGDTFAFSDETIRLGKWNIQADTWTLIGGEFVAQSDEATIFFLNKRMWPIPNNDSYIDDAFIFCEFQDETGG